VAADQEKLRVAVVQEASTLDPEQNRSMLEAAGSVAADSQPPLDLLVFPEAFARDFGDPGSDISHFAEDTDGPFVQQMCKSAAEHRLTIVAGMFERSHDVRRPYNTLAVVDHDGLRATYRKIHLYDSFGYQESHRLLAGEIAPAMVEVAGFTIGLMTCYDLRFPELARMLVDRGAELLVVPSAWVAGPAKVDHWRTLLMARAIENTVYVAASAQPAPRYCGHSMVISPTGEVLVELRDGQQIGEATVERDVLERARAQNPSLANRRLGA